jgi:hypothetical protein
MTDYLDTDAPIRGQKYASLSFVCPETILPSKDAYFFSEYVKSFSDNMTKLLKELETLYPDSKNVFNAIRDTNSEIFNEAHLQESYKYFVESNSEKLESAFHEASEFRTTVRGVKIRGVYATKKEAEVHISKLKTQDPNHNIWIGDMGAWLPFSDNPYNATSQEYAEEQLNKLMKEYKLNTEQKNKQFAQRKDSLIGESSKANIATMEGEDIWLNRNNEPN